MADPIVHITAGVPDSGTGNITTLGQTLVDGANIVMGATTDVVVAAGAAGSISAKLRAISRDIVANIVLAAGTNVVGKVGIDQTTPGTTNLVSIGTNGTVTAKTQDGSGNAITSATRGAERALTVQVVDGSGTQVTSFGGSSPTNTLLNITTATTTTVKSGAGTLVRIVINQTGTVASTATIYDSTTGSGTKIGTLDTLGATGSFTYDGAFSTGLTIVTTGTSAPNLTIVYR